MAVVLPPFAALSVAHAFTWGPFAALVHLVVGVVLSLLLVEVLLAGFDRIPFTCARASGDARVRWPLQVAALIAAAYGAAVSRRSRCRGAGALAAVAGGAAGVAAGIRVAARRWSVGADRLTFDVRPERAVQTLDI